MYYSCIPHGKLIYAHNLRARIIIIIIIIHNKMLIDNKEVESSGLAGWWDTSQFQFARTVEVTAKLVLAVLLAVMIPKTS